MNYLVAGKLAPLTEWQINDRAQRRANAEATRFQQIRDDIVFAVETQLNAFAATRGYDSILSACSYKDSAIPQFAADGAYCVELRDQTWAKLYDILADVEAGKRPMPASFDDIAAELPTASA